MFKMKSNCNYEFDIDYDYAHGIENITCQKVSFYFVANDHSICKHVSGAFAQYTINF